VSRNLDRDGFVGPDLFRSSAWLAGKPPKTKGPVVSQHLRTNANDVAMTLSPEESCSKGGFRTARKAWGLWTPGFGYYDIEVESTARPASVRGLWLFPLGSVESAPRSIIMR